MEDEQRPDGILGTLYDRAQELLPSNSQQMKTIRGAWSSEYALRLTDDHTAFHLHYVRVQTLHQGCCYYAHADGRVVLDRDLLGRSALDVWDQPKAVRIAALDAVYGSLKPPAIETVILDGANIDKSQVRAHVVCAEATMLLEMRHPGSRPPRVVLVGIVGDILRELTACKGVEVAASDFDSTLFGRSMHGVYVESGAATQALVANADVAVVTGMTLSNGSLDGILAVARDTGTAIVLFAETGANFAAEYCRPGIDAVVSEPYPFYLSGPGPTKLEVYRRSR